MLTANVIHRVFHFQYKMSQGTCFTMDVNNKQYLITAKHCVPAISKSDRIQILYQKKWQYLDVVLLGESEGSIDIAVFRPTIQLSPSFPMEPSLKDIIYGQDVYFVGFPYSLGGNGGKINRDFPLPLVKKAIISMIPSGEDEPDILYLDGHNNPGFSGAPVVFCTPYQPPSVNNPYKVAGVIIGNKTVYEPVYDESQKRTHLTHKYNTGIIMAHSINYALDIINDNPDGFEIQNQ